MSELDPEEIYVLIWLPGGKVPMDGLAFTDKERAERCAKHNNKSRKWYHRLAGGYWHVSTLRLITGKGKVHHG
jgi:hypothetical protein